MKYFTKFVVLFIVLFSSYSFAEIAIIVNKSNNTAIPDNNIKRIFMGKLKAYSNGDKILALNLKFGSSTRNEFDKKVLKKNSSQVKAYWSKLVFSGKGKPPPELVSDRDVLTLVSSDSNAIGYVDAASVDGSVRVIKKF